MHNQSLDIRAATPDEFSVASDFWVAMRRELDMPDADLAPDWKARTIAYFTRRHAAGELQCFLAREDEHVVASACGFLLDGYPSEICLRRRVGYIAGVYVLPPWRRRGFARGVTEAAVSWLWTIGCRAVRLHAADEARMIYEGLGFVASNEMILEKGMPHIS
jgi:GNAT superfamily N-acetyltransferase